MAESKSFKRGIIGSLFFLFSVAAVTSQTLSSLEEIAKFARENNLDYQKAEWDAQKAENNIQGLFRLKDSSISFTQSVVPDKSTGVTGLMTKAAVTFPVVNQVKLTAELDQDLSAAIGVQIEPVAHSDAAQQSRINFQKARLTAETKGEWAEINGIKKALSWMISEKEQGVQDKKANLKETLYNDEKVRYEKGEASLDDVKTALLAWSQARSALLEAQKKTIQARADLYTALGADPEKIKITVIGSEDLVSAIDKIQKDISPDKGDPFSVYSVLTENYNVSSAEAKLKNTWAFEPELTVDSSLSMGPAGDLAFSSSVKFSLSYDSINGKARKEAEKELYFSKQAASQSIFASKIAFDKAAATLKAAQRNREIREIEKEQTSELKDEANFLFKKGKMSEAELSDAVLSFGSAENDLYLALIDEYSAWLDLKTYMPQ